MKKFIPKTVCFFSLVLMGSLAMAADARLSKNRVDENNMVQLILTWNGDKDTHSNPDLKPLEQDFYIYGVGRGSEIQILNGKTSAKTQWTLTLLPKNTGILAIPPLTIGSEKTKALVLQVNKTGSQLSTGKPAQTAFIETSLSPKAFYIDMPIIYSVKIFYEGELVRGELSHPEGSNLVVTRLGEDKNDELAREGKTYHTIERRYLLLPKISGDLTPRPPVFIGEAAASPTEKAITSGGFIETIPVQAIAPAVHLHVNPKPSEASGQWWLPSSNVILREQWSIDPPVFHQGEALTRTIILQADNLSAEQLPPLNLLTVADMNTYPDKPVLDNKLTEKGLVGLREEKIAYIPTKAGKLTLPAITLNWFDVESQKMKTAQLSARIVNVLPGNPAENTANTLSLEQKANEANNINTTILLRKEFINIGTMVFAVLWIMTLILWRFLSRHKKNLKKRPSDKGSSLPTLYE
ncbi:MAG: hypothetical protein K0R12_450 [Gammaproteobacteria bacterium]|jgi:hypothetical protein|nr:hypothetical protein [Gammaproteobacteria bacterium]